MRKTVLEPDWRRQIHRFVARYLIIQGFGLLLFTIVINDQTGASCGVVIVTIAIPTPFLVVSPRHYDFLLPYPKSCHKLPLPPTFQIKILVDTFCIVNTFHIHKQYDYLLDLLKRQFTLIVFCYRRKIMQKRINRLRFPAHKVIITNNCCFLLIDNQNNGHHMFVPRYEHVSISVLRVLAR